MPVRVFETYDSYQRFLPLIYGLHADGSWESQGMVTTQMGSTNDVFSALCYNHVDNATIAMEIGNRICERLGYGESLFYGEEFGADYGITEAVEFVSPNNEMIPWWTFDSGSNNDCHNHTNLLVVQCAADLNGQGCLDSGMECATDLECCDRMFCSPVTGHCTTAVTYTFVYLSNLFRVPNEVTDLLLGIRCVHRFGI